MLNSATQTSSIKSDSNFMLKTGARLLFPIILLFGIYIMVYGHLSVGGGFQGGVIIASAILLMFVSSNNFALSHHLVEVVETFAGISYVAIGLIGLIVIDSFLGNFLPHSISQLGLLLSGGIVPIIYIIIGIKVGSEMSLIVQNMLKRSDND